MKTKDILTIATAAIGTATLTVAAFLDNPLNAGDSMSRFTTPKLVINNVELTLPPVQNQRFKAGDKPEFEIHAINMAKQPTHVSFLLTMSALATPSLISRTPAVPAMLWTQEETLALGPGETKQVKIPTGTVLPQNSEITVIMLDESSSTPAAKEARSPFAFPANVTAMSFSTRPTATRLN